MKKSIISNPVLDKLPKHLYQFIKHQYYQDYTPQNQATWRYVMRKNVAFLKEFAHESYIDGLKKTGISTEKIPNMYGMNRILQEIGWAAVAVDGFIPPAAFMEFQAYNVLVIASDIRPVEYIEYTPAPDIIHESAGHAPIIANPEYAEYLRRFGEIGSKAISSAKDYELYEAIRLLSLLKERKETSAKKIKAAEEKISYLQENMGPASEMAKIRNLHWWTVEYGLIGDLNNPKIYGAGLLSSIGESANCLKKEVTKLPYSIKAADLSFDITKPQPQLFVTPDFAHLSLVLEEFANTMALRTGGKSGLTKLMESKRLGTIELSTGLQVSGIFTNLIENEKGKVAYFQTQGETALSYREKELIGHSTRIHSHGFGSPVGKLKGINLTIEDMSPRDLEAYNIYEGRRIKLEFEGDITVDGEVITGTRNLQGKILIIAFKNCTVKHKEEILFHPDWGIYHMAVGKKIVSAYAGPADYTSFDLTLPALSKRIPAEPPNEEKLHLFKLYKKVRNIREGKLKPEKLNLIFEEIGENFTSEWLLLLEILEIAQQFDNQKVIQKTQFLLNQFQKKQPNLAHFVNNELALVE